MNCAWFALLVPAVAFAAPWDFLSPYLLGNMGPVKQERDADLVEIEGSIPPDLEGTYYRNGPNPLHPPRPYHWFDGDGMVHAFTFSGGTVRYRNRFVRTEGLVREMNAGRSLYGGLMAGPPFKNVANTSLLFHHGKLLALWEGGRPYELDPATLDTRGPYDFEGRLGFSMTAHPKSDPDTGEVIFFGYQQEAPYLHYYVASSEGKILHKTAVPTSGPVFIHDFVITKNFTLFFDLPAKTGFNGISDSRDSLPRVGVLPRYAQGSEVRWFPVEKSFVFHFLNAYDSPSGRIEVLGYRYPEMPDFTKPWAIPHPYRWSIEPSNGDVRETIVSRSTGDFPFVHPGHVGKRTRFGFASQGVGLIFGGLVKLDLETGAEHGINYGFLQNGGEASFVPRSSESDDGWLLTLVFNELTRKSELRIYDAKTFDGHPVAKIRLPYRVPYGFHGLWVGAEALRTTR